MIKNTTQYLKDYKTPDYTIEQVNLEFHLGEEKSLVTATSTIVQLTPGAVLRLDGDNLTLMSVAINGQVLNAGQYEVDEQSLTIVDLPSTFELSVVTQLNPSENTQLEGLYVSDGAFCTQCEAQGFRRITFYLDRPDVMAVFTTKVIADKVKYPYLLSNGNQIDSGELANGLHYATWHDPHKKPAYLFALVAGDFDLLQGEFVTKSGRKVSLQFFVDKGNAAKAHHAMASLKKAMRWDEERFDLEYDLDIYMVVAVDFFNMGAMENKGLNVFNSKYVLADNDSATDIDFHGIESVIGHEYFHNWTGNRITCRDWFQLSLKEGLTVFRDQEFSSDVGSRAVNRIDAVKIMRSHQFSEDAGPMAHPIRPEAVMEMNNFYTVTVYNKGAEVIRMIHTLLGEQRFQQGMKHYINKFDGMAVTCEDFIVAMEQGGGINLKQFRHWYSQAGTPTVSVQQEFEQSTSRLTLTLSQKCPITPDNLPKEAFHIPVALELINEDGSLVQFDGQSKTLLQLTKDSQQFVFDNIKPGVVPCLLGDFSAPVKLDLTYSNQQLAH
ncbi:MAG: aminopeptidase N, partial [Psychrobium sp.]|nr:aminopeptidase N [Psychrobium sp.]